MRLPHLLGNEALKTALADLPPGGLGSAVLLDGPAGIGKRTAARDLVQALLCREKTGPCGVCPACRRVAAGSHPDLFWLEEAEPGKGVRLEQVRAMRARSFLSPSEAPFQIFVIPRADKLNTASQNALLKVLEEPVSALFLLLCENRESMLQTVRSRCKTFRLAPLPPPLLEQALRARTGASGEDVRSAAARSAGLLGRGLEILAGQEPASRRLALQFCASLRQGELDTYAVCLKLGKLSREEYGDFCDESCRLLTEAAVKTGSGRFLDLFEYLEKQRAMLPQNPSVTALCSALAAFCGAA